MGKVVKVIAGVALVGVAIAATVATGGAFAAIGTALSGGLFGAGIVTAGFLATVGASLLASTFLIPKIPKSQLSRLNVSLDVSTPRKAVLGTTAFPLDLRYHEATGTDQEYIHYIIAHAAHKVQSIDSIYFEQDLAWTSASGVTSKYSGYLTVTTRTEGAAGNEVSISGNWGTGERLTGCAYTYIKIKRTGNTKKSDSPLVSGLPSRVTVIGEGAYLYDPRLDSTVTGGSGSHRADDQSTWGAGYSPADSYDNPALQLLWWLLGWKINGKLSIGCGVPLSRIDMESFIAAANICDEDVALSGGGTQKRYRSSGTASDADDRMDIINAFLSSMNGTLRDNGGKLSLDILKNDLAEYVLDLVDEDVLDEFQWEQTPSLSKTYNTARGRFVDPSANSLYQMVDYPEVNLAGGSPDGIDRVMTIDLPFVEEGRRAQRIAKQVLQRNQYRGQFSAVFSAKALGCDIGEIVRISFEPLGWSEKLFRVISKDITQDGRIPLTLLEENAAIYAWDAEEGAVVSATAPTVYDPLNSPFILGDLEAGTTADWPSVTDPVGTKPEDSATKNETTYSATPPASPTDGDIWVDTSTTPYKFKLRDGGAWVDASTLNTGALADLNDIDLSFVTDAGGFAALDNLALTSGLLTGTLPTAKADADLINQNQIYADVTGTPTSLSDVNAGEGSKLTGIAAGATVGATAGTNLFDSGAAVLNDEAVKNALQQWADILGPLKPEDSATKLRTFKDENEPYPVTLSVGDPAFDSPSLSMSFVDSFREGDVWFRPTSKLVARWDADTASWTTNLADITKTIAGPSGYTLTYNQSGVLQDTTPIKLYYRVSVAGGSALTSGVTWGVSTRLLTGQTDSDIWSGTAPSISGTGVGELSINSGLKVSQATVDVTATVGGTTYGPFAVLIGKQTVSTTSESSAFQSQSIAGTVVSGTTFTQIAALTVTTQPAGTSVDLTANTISFVCKDDEAYSPSNMQFKWQYESSPSTWTDVGAAADSNPDPFTIEEGGFYESTFGSITCDRTKSSLSSNTSYNFRLMARISSGETTKDFQIGLSESVSAEAV